MNLGDLIIRAQEKQINNLSCEICTHGIEITTIQNNKTKEVFLCRKGLKFPQCRVLDRGFKRK